MSIRSSIQGAFLCGAAIVMAAINPTSVLAKENALETVPHAVEAYIYGFPLVSMEMTRRVMTNGVPPATGPPTPRRLERS